MSTLEIPELEFIIDLQGESLYTKWLELGNVGTWADFLEWLKIKGDTGESAYDIWISLGHVGTEADFMTWLQTPAYEAGLTAVEAKNQAVAAKDTAVASASAAQASEVGARAAKLQAETAATNASTSETNAGISKLAAENAEIEAEAARDASVTAKNTATIQAVIATTQAGLATSKAGEASLSASNAATSETNAETAETNAVAAMDDAIIAKIAAETARTGAETAKTGSEAARDAALTDKTAAEAAKTAAETANTNAQVAKTAAETAATTATTKASEASSSANAISTGYPLIPFKNRVALDGGTIKDLGKLAKLIENDFELDKSTLFKWSGWSGVKTRTSGSNVYVTKAYDNSTNNNDAVQATEANQLFYAGNIAPNEVGGLKNVAYASNKKVGLTSQISFAAGASFSIDFDINIFAFADGAARRIYLNSASSAWIEFSTDGFIKLFGNYSIISSTPFDKLKYIGKINKIQIVKNATTTYVFINGQPVATSYADASILFNEINIGGIVGILYTFAIYNVALPKYRTDEKYISSKLSEIEGVTIGNQHFATSNYEGVVAGDGSVIGEYQYTAANSPNVIVNGDMSLATGGLANNWTANVGASQVNTIVTGNGFVGNAQRCVSAGGNTYAGIAQNGKVVNGKTYKVSFKYRTNSTTLRFNLGGTITIGLSANELDAITYTSGWIKSTSDIFLVFLNNDDSTKYFEVDDIVVKEAGWDEAQAVYDAVYAQTSGTAAVKDLAATKAASMWSYPDNDVLQGAIFGKDYNGYARKLIGLYSPKGYRAALAGDLTQLYTYLGGASVGGKYKAKFGVFNNSLSTNESGISITGCKTRNASGTFGVDGISVIAGIDKYIQVSAGDNNVILADVVDMRSGFPLRLLRNEPVGDTYKTISTDWIANALGAGNLDVVIPFGHVVENITIESRTGITSLSAKYCSRNPSTLAVTELNTLLTGKTITANVIMTLNTCVDQNTQLQDAVVRINGTKSDTAEFFKVDIKIKKA